ncbi:MAG: dephospho-CoA kinase [Clostridiales bacterium]|nr:dephospho-CoA kinase [Clostridiales bacterium]
MIGLTGGIASGKSTVTARLRALGAFVADADLVSREAVASPEVLSRIREAFGDSVIAADGTLDRLALAEKVFSSSAKTAQLDAITHPAIIKRLLELTGEAEKAGVYPLVFVDAALLIESGFNKYCDGVWLVTANRDVRIRRIMARDGLSYDDAVNRIDRQMSDEEKLPFATTVIENDSTIEELIKRVDEAFFEEAAGRRNGLPGKDDYFEENGDAFTEE